MTTWYVRCRDCPYKNSFRHWGHADDSGGAHEVTEGHDVDVYRYEAGAIATLVGVIGALAVMIGGGLALAWVAVLLLKAIG